MINNENKKKKNKKYKFTEKRNPYKKYYYTKWNWTDIFLEIENLKNTDHKVLKTISKKYNINYGTLKNKYNKYKNNTTNINNENNTTNTTNTTTNRIPDKKPYDLNELKIIIFLRHIKEDNSNHF